MQPPAPLTTGTLCRLEGVTVYLFYSQHKDEAAVAAWLAPLGVVRRTLGHEPARLNSASVPACTGCM